MENKMGLREAFLIFIGKRGIFDNLITSPDLDRRNDLVGKYISYMTLKKVFTLYHIP